jgi:toxin ParE1/3/4
VTRLRVRPQARTDLDEGAEYYALEANVNVATRFLESVDRAFARLGEHPFIGVRMAVLDPGLSGLRSWPVTDFERHLVLYFASDSVVDVVRVVHSARSLAMLAATSSFH